MTSLTKQEPRSDGFLLLSLPPIYHHRTHLTCASFVQDLAGFPPRKITPPLTHGGRGSPAAALPLRDLPAPPVSRSPTTQKAGSGIVQAPPASKPTGLPTKQAATSFNLPPASESPSFSSSSWSLSRKKVMSPLPCSLVFLPVVLGLTDDGRNRKAPLSAGGRRIRWPPWPIQQLPRR